MFFHLTKDKAMSESSSSHGAVERSSSEGDRRVWVRYPSRKTIYCRPAVSDGEELSVAHACDVSLGGIKLLSAHKFERGTILKIKTTPDDPDQPFFMTAEVRYATPMPEGNWIMGCAFVTELSEKDLLAWLDA
jgi:hypothetical protein